MHRLVTSIFVVALVCTRIWAQGTFDAKAASEWPTRARLYAQLNAPGSAAADPKRAAALVGILRTENQLLKQLENGPNAENNASQVLGEAYIDYYYSLYDACLEVAAAGFDDAYVELARGAYEPGTAAAEKLLAKPQLILPAVLEDTAAMAPIARFNALRMLEQIDGKHRSALSESDQSKVYAALQKLKADPNKDIVTVATAVLAAGSPPGKEKPPREANPPAGQTIEAYIVPAIAVLAGALIVVLLLVIIRRRKH